MCRLAQLTTLVYVAFSEAVSSISEMATTRDIVNDVLFEDRLVQMWPDYPCLYDARPASFKCRDVRQLAMEERL